MAGLKANKQSQSAMFGKAFAGIAKEEAAKEAKEAAAKAKAEQVRKSMIFQRPSAALPLPFH